MTVPEFGLDPVKLCSSSRHAIPINAEYEEVRHPSVLLNHFPDARNLQRFADATEQRVLADADTHVPPANGCEEPLEQWF